MSAWKKLPAIRGGFHGCLCCGVTTDKFAADDTISVGFGYAALERDGVPVWVEPMGPDDNEAENMTGQQAENMAASDPDHDWRIRIHGPMRGRVYQRHTAGEWVLVEKDGGFA